MINLSKNKTFKFVLFILLFELVFWMLYTFVIQSFTSSGLMYKFPNRLNALIILLPLFAIYIYHFWRKEKFTEEFHFRTLKSFVRTQNRTFGFIKYLLIRNAVVFLIIALAQPVFGSKKVTGTAETLELVIALDISNSMNVKDISPEISRLEISKRAVIELINNLHGERIGICLFANSAFVQLPITRDYSAAKLFINEISTDMITSQGTNIDAAITTSAEMFSKERCSKGIILITDGENHEVAPSTSLKELNELNIQLSVMGIGTDKGGVIPKFPERPELGYKTTASGKTVVSKLDKRFIQKIAQSGNGTASISSSEFPDLSVLLTQINHMKRVKIDNLEFDIKEERYQLPLSVAIICFISFMLWESNFKNLISKKN